MNKVQLNLPNCPRCGKSHAIEVTPFALVKTALIMKDEFTHFGKCPYKQNLTILIRLSDEGRITKIE